MRWLLLLLALTSFLPAQPKKRLDCTFVVHTYPEGAQVLLHRGPNQLQLNNPGISSAQLDFVGTSGQPIHLDLAPYQDDRGRIELPLTVSLPGHEDFQVVANNDVLKGAWPPNGTLSLKPTSWDIGLFDFLRSYWVPLLAICVAGTGLVGLGVWQVNRQRHLEKHKREVDALRQHGDPYLGSKMGEYRIMSQLGAGGMAVVYRARQENRPDAESVAIKVVAQHIASDNEFSQRFRREVQAYMKLDHPNIVRLIDWGQNPSYLVMERIDGITLRDAMSPNGLSVEQVVTWLLPMLDAVAYAHSKGIVHRDLKPDNVMLQKGKLIKVMDFGLARSQQVSTKITGTGNVLGTPAYMSPEQIDGMTDPAADQYSLGIMAYEMLAGRLPFVGEPMKVLLAHLTETIPPLGQFRQGLPKRLESLVMRMLARNPADRYTSLVAVRRELELLFPQLAQPG